jgi:hypothetical protein
MAAQRTIFLEAASAATELLGRPELAERWRSPSALAQLSTAGLAGHLLRGILTVEIYLDAPQPSEAPISAAAYFSSLGLSPELEDPVNRFVRERGELEAEGGPADVALRASLALERLLARLPAEPPERCVRVIGERVLRLDDYLATRVVELCLHADDLAAGLGIDLKLPEEATGLAIETLLAVARSRHGDLAVLRALARRERDEVEALRVI